MKRLKELEQKLEIKNLDDWYSIKYEDVENNGGRMLLQQYEDSLTKMLLSFYPEFEWDPTR